jgi:hypothetical protein
VLFESGDQHTGNDFGNYQLASKSGSKFNDLNANGSWDSGEPGLDGWVIRAYVDSNKDGVLQQTEYNAGPADSNTTVATTGAYILEDLEPDYYIIVEVLQLGWTQTYPGTSVLDTALVPVGETLGAYGYAIELTSGEDETGNDFGNYVPIKQGCTPGYWKNNPKDGPDPDDLNDWPSPYLPTDLISSVFTNLPSEFYDLDGEQGEDTLMDALKYHGGPGLRGAVRNLMRHAVAALLNAAHPCINYQISTPQGVINAVEDLFDDPTPPSRWQVLSLKNNFDEWNNAGCPCNAHGECPGCE